MTIPLTGLMSGLLVIAPAVNATADSIGSPVTAESGGDRVIVFFDGTPSATSVLNASTDETDLSYVRSVSRDIRVYRTSTELSGGEVSRLNADLSALPNVAEVRLDTRVEPTAMTLSDPYYALYQHSLFGTYGINAEPAWSITKGAGVTVAVIDTGLLMNHVDISSNVVGGYDFVSATSASETTWPYVPRYFTANDGDGWDSDPSDPGDWGETDAELQARRDTYTAKNALGVDTDKPTPSRICAYSDSNWHGSHVAGTIGALQDNAKGISGIAPQTKIVPVRALGRCGGYMSDLLSAMRWAAGLTVSGAPTNPNPARIMNLSLGASDTLCSGSLATAVNDVTAAGALIVAAAGNDNLNAASTFPANCTNVLSVASVDDNGVRSFFSNYGSTIDIAAPGEGILSLNNLGKTAPETNTYRFMQGTSMATPHVTGVAALALAVNPYLTVAELRSALLEHVKSFAPDSVPAPTVGDAKYPTCNMSSSCGSGIVDAGAAVQYAAENVRPGPPTAVGAQRDKTDVTVSWTAPTNTGSSAIINYVVQANGTDRCTTTDASASSCTIEAMSPGTYTFTVQAVNTQGRSPLSSPSDSLVVVSKPSVARDVSVSRTGRSVTVSWSAPESTGGLSVSYDVSGLPSGTVTTSALSATFDSLTIGTTYTFAVTAKNDEGSATPVSALPVTVVVPPSSVRNVVAERSGQSVTVSWDPPSESGGLPVTYTVSAGPGGSATTSATSYTFNNLATGIYYTFWVTAMNDEGASYAEPSSPVGVFTAPTAVQNASASATVGSVTLSWTPPAQSGGHAVSYFITGGPGGLVSTSATTYTFSSLQPGTTYSFLVFASNPEGSSAAVTLFSTPLSPPPPAVTTTTVKLLPPLTKVSRGSKTALTRIFVAPKGATAKWYASGPCFISSSRVVATRLKGTCRLTVLSSLKGVKSRKVFTFKVQ